jgi:hypothetical protein
MWIEVNPVWPTRASFRHNSADLLPSFDQTAGAAGSVALPSRAESFDYPEAA